MTYRLFNPPSSLFAVVMAHLGAALLHAVLFRDRVFESMATLRPGDGGDR